MSPDGGAQIESVMGALMMDRVTRGYPLRSLDPPLVPNRLERAMGGTAGMKDGR
jgi:hypothetical protein